MKPTPSKRIKEVKERKVTLDVFLYENEVREFCKKRYGNISIWREHDAFATNQIVATITFKLPKVTKKMNNINE